MKYLLNSAPHFPPPDKNVTPPLTYNLPSYIQPNNFFSPWGCTYTHCTLLATPMHGAVVGETRYPAKG